MANLTRISSAAGPLIDATFIRDKADAIPDGKIMLGGPWPSAELGLTLHTCYLCKQTTTTRASDEPMLRENPDMTIVCVKCFRELQEE